MPTDACGECNGTGGGPTHRKCDACNGRGTWKEYTFDSAGKPSATTIKCESCTGTGRMENPRCKGCGGTGKVKSLSEDKTTTSVLQERHISRLEGDSYYRSDIV